MSEERKKVLEMLAAGKITADEAEKLLDKLAGNASNATPSAETSSASAASGSAKPKYLRIVVDQPGREQVNERLAEYGINAGSFATLNIDDLGQAMRELHVDVDRGDGKTVKIFCE